jgi:hypothetical protein
MEKQKKFFFKREENALELFTKLDRNQMSKIVGSYSERTYAESTGTKKPRDPKLDKLAEEMPTLPAYYNFEI